MSSKHFFHEYDGLVLRSLRGLILANPSLALVPEHKVVYNPSHDDTKVAIISGGGSGHEPAWSGYVGTGMLAAAVNGDVFGSPSAAQVTAAIESVRSEKGTILVITNYTGDKLHFGLASEKARARGMEVSVLAITDDVALGRERAGMVGRRGLAGNVLGLKILGAAAEAHFSFKDCLSVGRSVNDNLVTVGASLDHCHVLGRINHESLAHDTCVLGMGIHNEPGLEYLTPLPSPESLISQMLSFLLDPEDKDRSFVRFQQSDEVAILINNFGGTSILELQALTSEAVSQLGTTWKIQPSRVFCGTFETSLNGPGFSITLLNISATAKQAGLDKSVIMRLLDGPTTAPAWPSVKWEVSAKNSNSSNNGGPRVARVKDDKECTLDGDRLIEPKLCIAAIKRACERAIASEPDLTTWDMEMGDGDCGESVKAVCLSVLASIESTSVEDRSLLSLLDTIGASVDAMGGTLGAIFGIFLAALISSIKRQVKSTPLNLLFATAVYEALQGLKSHSGARVGDRTVMDALIPFCEIYKKTQSFKAAVKGCSAGAMSTRGMTARFGRATYVKRRDGYVEPPDPGAWAVQEMVQGLWDVIGSES